MREARGGTRRPSLACDKKKRSVGASGKWVCAPWPLHGNAVDTLEKWLSEQLPSVEEAEREKILAQIADEFMCLHAGHINLMLEPIAKHEAALLKEAKAGVASCDLHSWGMPAERCEGG